MKKIIAVLLVVLIVTLSFTGCLKDNKQPTDVSGSTKSTSSTQDNKKDEVVKMYMLSVQGDFDKQTEQREKVHQTIIDKTGVDLQLIFTSRDKIVEKANLMMSAKEQIDIVPRYPVNLAMQLYADGGLMAITPEMLEKAPNLKGAYSEEEWASVYKDGIYLGAPKVNSQLMPSLLQIRTDWLEKLEKPIPKTVDELEKVFDAFLKGDLDGNGKDDTIPIMSSKLLELEQAIAPFFTKNSTGWWLDENGKLLPPELAPDYKDYLKKLQSWHDKGYIYKEIMTTNIETKQELVAQNKVGAFANNWTYLLYGGWEVLAKSNPEAEYEPIVIQGPGVNKYLVSNPASQVNIITKICKYPEKAMKLFDYQGSPEGFYLMTYGIEGENYKKLDSGNFEIIGENKQDWKAAQYYILYMIFEPFPAWRERPWPMETWVYGKMNELNPKIKALPVFAGPDTYTVYDTSKFASQSKINDLDTYLEEAKIQVLTGKKSADDWDSIMKTWLEIGGQELIDDKNAQFKAK